MLDQAELVPACEFLVGQVGNPAPHGGLGGGFVEGKIQADAAHAFFLERDVVETDARLRRVGGRPGVQFAVSLKEPSHVDHLHDTRKLDG